MVKHWGTPACFIGPSLLSASRLFPLVLPAFAQASQAPSREARSEKRVFVSRLPLSRTAVTRSRTSESQMSGLKSQ